MSAEPVPGGVPLPPHLQREADALLAADEADRVRRARRKRFVLGISEEELEGFHLGGRPLQIEDVPQALRDPPPLPPLPLSRVEDLPLEDDWLAFAARLQGYADEHLLTDPDFAALLADYRDTGQLPDWLLALGEHQQSEIFDVRRAKPCRKWSDQIAEQSQFLQALRVQRPELAHYHVPMIPFRLTGERYICVMPRLAQFLTLHELLGLAAGLVRREGFTLTAAEREPVFQQIAAQLARILELSAGAPPDPQRVRAGLLAKLEERLGDEHRVPILIGPRLYQSCRARILDLARRQSSRLLYERRDGGLAFGHGDLNATNIMIALRRDAHGTITDVCVRLIDPNPAGSLGDSFFELGRMMHWIELALPLRLARDPSRTPQSGGDPVDAVPAVAVEFPAADPLEQWPQIVLPARWQQPLAQAYAAFLRALHAAIPACAESEAADRLGLAVGLYHLVGARYWPRCLDRTVAFLAGADELEALEGPRRIAATSGLWSARCPIRGRRPV